MVQENLSRLFCGASNTAGAGELSSAGVFSANRGFPKGPEALEGLTESFSAKSNMTSDHRPAAMTCAVPPAWVEAGIAAKP